MKVLIDGVWKDTSRKFARDYVKYLQRTIKTKGRNERIEQKYLQGVTIAELFRKGVKKND